MMKCAACHHDMVKKRGQIDLRIGGKLYLVENVFYEECPSCGEKVLSPEISDVLFRRINNKEFVEQTIRVPVLDG
ncbi:MAG: YgiT-type zinc finger protein [Deltaproteobacteria bacterium]|nr:YgiT-type zinc finger protein [Deltaproteobacteria bacterium]